MCSWGSVSPSCSGATSPRTVMTTWRPVLPPLRSTGPSLPDGQVLGSRVPAQCETELGAAIVARLRPDPPVHGFHEATRDEQADPAARGLRAGPRGPVEHLEQTVGLLGRDARTPVEHAHPHLVLVGLGPNLDR